MARKLTPFGREVKMKLLDMDKTQKEVCQENDIKMSRFSEALYSDQLSKKHRKKIAKILNINIPA